jgi:hypothetical protein
VLLSITPVGTGATGNPAFKAGDVYKDKGEFRGENTKGE